MEKDTIPEDFNLNAEDAAAWNKALIDMMERHMQEQLGEIEDKRRNLPKIEQPVGSGRQTAGKMPKFWIREPEYGLDQYCLVDADLRDFLRTSPDIIADAAGIIGESVIRLCNSRDASHYQHFYIIVAESVHTNTKDLSPLALLPRPKTSFIWTQYSGKSAMPVAELADTMAHLGVDGLSKPSLGEALLSAMTMAGPDDLIYVCGNGRLAEEAHVFFNGVKDEYADVGRENTDEGLSKTHRVRELQEATREALQLLVDFISERYGLKAAGEPDGNAPDYDQSLPLFNKYQTSAILKVLNPYLKKKLEASELSRLLNEGSDYIEGGSVVSVRSRKQRYLIAIVDTIMETLKTEDQEPFLQRALERFKIEPNSYHTEVSKINTARGILSSRQRRQQKVVNPDVIDLQDYLHDTLMPNAVHHDPQE